MILRANRNKKTLEMVSQFKGLLQCARRAHVLILFKANVLALRFDANPYYICNNCKAAKKHSDS